MVRGVVGLGVVKCTNKNRLQSKRVSCVLAVGVVGLGVVKCTGCGVDVRGLAKIPLGRETTPGKLSPG
jgi:hypothetical protein